MILKQNKKRFSNKTKKDSQTKQKKILKQNKKRFSNKKKIFKKRKKLKKLFT